MKKIILALIALAFAFAFSSCCDQNYCPSKLQCTEKEENNQPSNETPYRWDQQQRSERPRRW